MAGVLGFEFRLGPEVPRPTVWDFTMPDAVVEEGRRAWATAIDEAVQFHDAWGVLRTRPDCDVNLFDVMTPGSLMEATGRGGTVHLLLAREARREAPRMVESLDDLRAVVAGVTPGRPLVLVDRRGWPWTVQADDGVWLVRVPERFAAPRFACELAGEWVAAGAAVRGGGWAPWTVGRFEDTPDDDLHGWRIRVGDAGECAWRLMHEKRPGWPTLRGAPNGLPLLVREDAGPCDCEALGVAQ